MNNLSFSSIAFCHLLYIYHYFFSLKKKYRDLSLYPSLDTPSPPPPPKYTENVLFRPLNTYAALGLQAFRHIDSCTSVMSQDPNKRAYKRCFNHVPSPSVLSHIGHL
jgi:hypothetical protein